MTFGCNEMGSLGDVVGMRGMEQTTTAEIEALYRREGPGLLRLAFLLTGSRETAEDAVQTAFAEVQTRWSEIERHGAYVRQVVVNRSKDEQRRLYRTSQYGLEGTTEIPEIDETWQVISRLSSTQRAVVVLRFYGDLALTDIAVLLDRPEATVRSDLHRALKRLRRTLP